MKPTISAKILSLSANTSINRMSAPAKPATGLNAVCGVNTSFVITIGLDPNQQLDLDNLKSVAAGLVNDHLAAAGGIQVDHIDSLNLIELRSGARDELLNEMTADERAAIVAAVQSSIETMLKNPAQFPGAVGDIIQNGFPGLRNIGDEQLRLLQQSVCPNVPDRTLVRRKTAP